MTAADSDTPSRPARPGKVTPRQWAALALLCVLAFALGGILRQAGPVGTDISDRIDVEPLLSDTTSPGWGPQDASVTLVVFTDYQCSPCRLSYPALVDAVEADGDVRVVVREYPALGPVSLRASKLALAMQEQGLYHEVHDAMMRERRQLEPAVLQDIVERAGGDWERARARMENADIATQIALNQSDAMRIGVPGTPTYLIGPYRTVGAKSADQFAAAFEQAREAS